jgi:hypothetical protein
MRKGSKCREKPDFLRDMKTLGRRGNCHRSDSVSDPSPLLSRSHKTRTVCDLRHDGQSRLPRHPPRWKKGSKLHGRFYRPSLHATAESQAGSTCHGRLQPCQQQQGLHKATVRQSRCDQADCGRRATHHGSDDRKQLGRRCSKASHRTTLDIWPEHHRRLRSVGGDSRSARRTCWKCSISASLSCFDFWQKVGDRLCAHFYRMSRFLSRNCLSTVRRVKVGKEWSAIQLSL